MDMKTTEITEININSLFEKIASVIEEARRRASTAINLSEVYAKFNVGRYIVEDEQGGKERAAYGKQVLEQLSKKIEERFGEGWSVDTLKRCRKFYSIYSTPAIGATVLHQSETTTDFVNSGNRRSGIEKPEDIIKNPITLEFLGLKPEAAYLGSPAKS